MAMKTEKVDADKLNFETLDAEKPFKEHWSNTIFPVIRPDYERLVKAVPTRIAEKHHKKEAEKENTEKTHQTTQLTINSMGSWQKSETRESDGMRT